MPRTDIWGIEDGYEDALGEWHDTPRETRRAILAAMGVGGESDEPCYGNVLVAEPGCKLPLPGPAEVSLEQGGAARVAGFLPADLPLGYHKLRSLNGGVSLRLIVAPKTCYLPENFRAWGWAVQLYSARSAASWGIGDLADLRRLASWSARNFGARVILVNPLCAAAPVIPQEVSPYFPASRIYKNPLYLRIEELPGAAEAGVDLERLAEAGRTLNSDRRIDRNAIFSLKMEALRLLWSRFEGDPAFDRYCAQEGDALFKFGAYCVLAERYGGRWSNWPAKYRHPSLAGVGEFLAENARHVRFHQWLQWLLEEQLAKASEELLLIHDFPIGFDPEGADSWMWQDHLALGATVGAPPDEYNTQGQNWGLPPFVPHKLRTAGYEPFIQTIRATLRQAGGLRIDHVMGLFRLFWIPEGFSPTLGAYVRYPADDLLAIVGLESHRARSFVVGEDLGTVEEEARRKLAERAILSYKVLWFETDSPRLYPERSLASVTTHDLPTIAGLWTGADLRLQEKLGLKPNEKGMREIRSRIKAMTGLTEGARIEEVIARVHELLAETSSMVVVVALEDVLGVEERPNMPNTTADQWPNWSLALPGPLESIESCALMRTVGATLGQRVKSVR